MQPFDVTRVSEDGHTNVDDYLRNDPGPYSHIGVVDDEGNASGDLRWYVNWVKGETADVEWMTPADYLARCDRENRRGTERTLEIAERMADGEVFGMPWYSADEGTYYLGSSQEGAHRAAAAELLGVELIPVVVIRDFPRGAHIAHVTSATTLDESSWAVDGELLAYELYDSPHSTDCMFAGYVMPTGREWECTIYGDGGGITKRMAFPGLLEAKVYVELMAPQNGRVGYAAECTIEKGVADMGNLTKKNGSLSKSAGTTVEGWMSIPVKVEAMSYDGTLIDYDLDVYWTINTFGDGSNFTQVRIEDISYELADEGISDASGDDVADLVCDVAADNDIIIDEQSDAAIVKLVISFDSDVAKVQSLLHTYIATGSLGDSSHACIETHVRRADVDNVQIVMDFWGADDSWYYYFRYRCPEWRKYDGVFAKIEQVNGQYQWIVVDSIEYRKLGEGISDNMLDATDACMEAFSEGVLMKGASRFAAVEPMQFEYKGYEKDEDIELWLSVDSEYSITLDWNTYGTGYELCRESDGEFLGRYEFDEFDDVSKRQAWSDAVMYAAVDQVEQASGVKLPRDYWGNPITASEGEDSFALDPRVPDEVDSQKNNQTCPFCGSDSFDGEKCSVCGYEVPPEGFDDIEIDDKDEREDPKDEEESEDEDDAEEDDDE